MCLSIVHKLLWLYNSDIFLTKSFVTQAITSNIHVVINFEKEKSVLSNWHLSRQKDHFFLRFDCIIHMIFCIKLLEQKIWR